MILDEQPSLKSQVNKAIGGRQDLIIETSTEGMSGQDEYSQEGNESDEPISDKGTKKKSHQLKKGGGRNLVPKEGEVWAEQDRQG